jgi:hypothetical protein
MAYITAQKAVTKNAGHPEFWIGQRTLVELTVCWQIP